MKISVLGTGMVGRSLAARLTDLDHEVFMGTRDLPAKLSTPSSNQDAEQNFGNWCWSHPSVTVLNLEELPAETDLYINATNGQASIEALRRVGKMKLTNKVLLDIANPLDFTNGMPPSLSICNTDSLGETIQRTFPESRVVKSLNTMNAHLMVNPALLPDDHSVFLSGDDQEAKSKVRSILQEMGWKNKNIIDLGDIATARGTEMLLPVWLRLWSALGTSEFNFNIVRK